MMMNADCHIPLFTGMLLRLHSIFVATVVVIVLESSISYALLLSTIPGSSNRLHLLTSLAAAARGKSLTIEQLEDSTRLAPGRTEIEVLLGRSGYRNELREAWDHVLGKKGKEEKHLSVEENLGWKAWKSSLAKDHADVEANLERFRRVVALRQNRVLTPGRAAELYVSLVSSLINANEWGLAKR